MSKYQRQNITCSDTDDNENISHSDVSLLNALTTLEDRTNYYKSNVNQLLSDNGINRNEESIFINNDKLNFIDIMSMNENNNAISMIKRAEFINGDGNGNGNGTTGGNFLEGDRKILKIKDVKSNVIENNNDLRELIKEANLLRKIKHKNIVSFEGLGSYKCISLDDVRKTLFFAEEMVDGETLKQILINQTDEKYHKRIYWMKDAYRWILQIAKALAHLHNSTPCVIYGELNPNGILLTSTNDQDKLDVKISNFVLNKCIDKVKQMKLNNLFSEKTQFEDNENNDIFSISSKNKEHNILIKETKSMVNMQELQQKQRKNDCNHDYDYNYDYDCDCDELISRAKSLPISQMTSLEIVPEDKPVNIKPNSRSPLLYMAKSAPNTMFRDKCSITIVKPIKKERPIINESLNDIIKKEKNNCSINIDLKSNDSILSQISLDKKVRGGIAGEMLRTMQMKTSDEISNINIDDEIIPFEISSSNLSNDYNTSESSIASPALSLECMDETNHLLSINKIDVKSNKKRHSKSNSVENGQSSIYGSQEYHYNDDNNSIDDDEYLLNDRLNYRLDSKQHGSSRALDKLIQEENSSQNMKKTTERKRMKTTSYKFKEQIDIFNNSNQNSDIIKNFIYKAPEVILGKSYDEKIDVYAFGILMYELFNSDMLMMRILSKAQNTSEINKLIHEYIANMLNGFREQLPSKWPQKLKDLINDCWADDPKKRPSMSDVVIRLNEMESSQNISDMDKDLLYQQSYHIMNLKLNCCSIM